MSKIQFKDVEAEEKCRANPKCLELIAPTKKEKRKRKMPVVPVNLKRLTSIVQPDELEKLKATAVSINDITIELSTENTLVTNLMWKYKKIGLFGDSLLTTPKKSLRNLFSVMEALLFGTVIPKEQQVERLKICLDCDYAVQTGDSVRCGICGCKNKGGPDAILVLLKYEEKPHYGCKHPEGSRWKAAGV